MWLLFLRVPVHWQVSLCLHSCSTPQSTIHRGPARRGFSFSHQGHAEAAVRTKRLKQSFITPKNKIAQTHSLSQCEKNPAVFRQQCWYPVSTRIFFLNVMYTDLIWYSSLFELTWAENSSELFWSPVVPCPSVFHKLMTFLSSWEPLGQFQPNMTQSILDWFKFIQMKGRVLFQGEIITK